MSHETSWNIELENGAPRGRRQPCPAWISFDRSTIRKNVKPPFQSDHPSQAIQWLRSEPAQSHQPWISEI